MKVIYDEPADVYHSKAGKYLSSHLLGLFRKSPRMYRMRVTGLLPDADSDYYRIGRAAHTLILEGRKAFQKEWLVGDGPINQKTGNPYGPDTKAAKEWRNEVRQGGQDVLSTNEWVLVERMQQGVIENAYANDLLSGSPELVIRGEMMGVNCQVRCDMLKVERKRFIDLKTCRDLDNFAADSVRYQYLNQFAFYRRAVREAFNIFPDVYVIAVEKQEPHRCGVWLCDPASLLDAEAENAQAIRRLKEYQASGDWPTGYETVRILTGKEN